MEKQMLEMMGKMMEQITGMQSDMKDMKSKMNERFDAVDARLDTVDARLDNIDVTNRGIGKQFELITEQKDDSIREVKKELKYITHQIRTLDREVFMRTDSLQ